MSSMTLMTSMIPITSMTMMTGDFGDFDDFDDFVTLMTLWLWWLWRLWWLWWLWILYDYEQTAVYLIISFQTQISVWSKNGPWSMYWSISSQKTGSGGSQGAQCGVFCKRVKTCSFVTKSEICQSRAFSGPLILTNPTFPIDSLLSWGTRWSIE